MRPRSVVLPGTARHSRSPHGIDLYWLPLGAGGHSVRLNGRIFEAVTSLLERRPPCDLYHSALEVRVPEGRFVIEQAPVRDSDGPERGVVAEGAVGSRWAGRFRIFRYEVRCWRGGTIPDVDEAVSPRRLTGDPDVARQVLELAAHVPTPVWGRDELAAGEMWNSNSLIAWLIARSGLSAEAIRPPSGGRAPGWCAGVVVAHREEHRSRSFPQARSATPRMAWGHRAENIRFDSNREEAMMKVRELMTRQVLTIGPEAPIKDVAKILVQNRISGLPVCDIEGHVLGVVSEGDILYKQHDPTEGHRGGPLGRLIEGAPNYRGYTKAKALAARKAMTSPAITIAPHESVSEAARIMSERGVNRLPVVQDEKLVGIITRADLVRAFTRTDTEIEQEIRDDVLERTLWIEVGRVEVAVTNGVVTLAGRLHTRRDVELLCQLAARVPGVSSVESTLEWEVDDTTRRGRRALEKLVG